MLEIAERLEAGYNMISNIDPHNLSEMDAFRRIKNTYKDILLKLNKLLNLFLLFYLLKLLNTFHN